MIMKLSQRYLVFSLSFFLFLLSPCQALSARDFEYGPECSPSERSGLRSAAAEWEAMVREARDVTDPITNAANKHKELYWMLFGSLTKGNSVYKRFDEAINSNVRVSLRCDDSHQILPLNYIGQTISPNRWTARVGVNVPVYYPSAWPDAYIRQDDLRGYFRSNNRPAYIYEYLHGSPTDVLDTGRACDDVNERAYQINHRSRPRNEVEIVLCPRILRHYTVNDLSINLATGTGLSGKWHSNIKPVSFTLVHELCHGIYDMEDEKFIDPSTKSPQRTSTFAECVMLNIQDHTFNKNWARWNPQNYAYFVMGHYLTSRNSFSLTRFPGIGQFISDTSNTVPTTAGGLHLELKSRSSDWSDLYNELLTGLKDLAGGTTTPGEWIQVFQPNQAVLDLVHNTYPNPAGP